MQLVVSDRKSGKTAQREVQKEKEVLIIGKKIGEVIDGSIVGLNGFTLKITGFTDISGFPGKKGIEGTKKIRIIIKERKGKVKRRKTVRGDTISNDTKQVNTVIEEYGNANLDEFFAKKEKSEK